MSKKAIIVAAILTLNLLIAQHVLALISPSAVCTSRRQYNVPSFCDRPISSSQQYQTKNTYYHTSSLLSKISVASTIGRSRHSWYGGSSRSSSSRLMSTGGTSTINSYDEAIEIVDECSTTSQPSDRLYDAVRYIDRNAKDIYPNLEAKEAMWSRGYGSWRLVLATGGGRNTAFKPVPIFAYARVDETTFGNGVGLNENIILLSLLGPRDFDAKKRQMKICIDDMFIFSWNVTNVLPEFVSKGINLKKRPNDFSGKKGDRIPAFTFIGSSDKSLIARGGSGGIAIWTRLEKDIKGAAYASETITSEYSL